MENETVAMVGFGDLGERLAARLSPHRWRCAALRRRAHSVPEGVRGLPVDFSRPETLQVLESLQPDVLFITLSPDDRSPAGYRRGFHDAMRGILDGLGSWQPRRAVFVSSTRVYSEAEGNWVYETGDLAVDDPAARAIIDSEQLLLDALPGAVVLRAGGLYGNGPGQLLKRVAAGRLSPAQPLRFSNRIHRDDLAGFVEHLMQLDHCERIYNAVDNASVALQEVERWLCEALQQPWEPPVEETSAVPAHKRIANRLLRAAGYELQYPDYRAGYAAVLHRWMAHSDREDGLDLH